MNGTEITTLKKPIEMVVMKPKNGKITLLGRRLYTLLLAHAQEDMDGVDTGERYQFQSPLWDILKNGTFKGGEITLIKKYLKEMNTTSVEWESTAPGDGVKWKVVSMISEAGIKIVNGKNWIFWEFPSSILKMILDPVMYANLNLKFATDIESYAGTALYEICCRYKDNPSGLTSRKPTDWWIDALSQTARDPSKRREWRKFKDEKLLPGIEHIKESTDLEVELIEHRSGKIVSEVQFRVKRKSFQSQSKMKAVDAQAIDDIEKMCSTLSMPIARVEPLIKRFGEESVKNRMNELKKRIEDKSQPPVEKKVGYLRFLLENDSLIRDQVSSQSSQETKQTNSNNEVNSSNVASELVFGDSSSGSTSRLNRSSGELILTELREKPAQLNAVKPSIRATIRDEFNKLSETERKRYMALVCENLKSRGLFGAIELKDSQASTIKAGIFGSAVVELYGKDVYGESWVAPQGLKAPGA